MFAVRPGKAARLDAGVDTRADNWLGASLRRPLSPGQVLNAVQGRPGLYCDGLLLPDAPTPLLCPDILPLLFAPGTPAPVPRPPAPVPEVALP